MSDPEQPPASLHPLEILIRRVPFFRNLYRVDLARLIGRGEEVRFTAGAIIFSEGAEPDAMYLLEAGRVAVSVRVANGEETVAELDAPAYFGELGLLLERRTGSARALTDVVVWRLPRQRFEQLFGESQDFGLAVARALAAVIDQRSRERVGAPPAQTVRRPAVPDLPQTPRSAVWRAGAAVIAFGVPLLLWGLAPPRGLSLQGWHVSLVVLGAALGWLLEPAPDFVVALAMVTVWGVAGLAPLSLAFAGFASPVWFLALGALGIGSALIRSGLLFRLALWLLKTFPATHVGQVLALLIGGMLVTPFVPLAIARVAAVASLSRELADVLGYRAWTRASAALSFAGLIGYGSFSSVFLTGLAMNFFVLGLLPAHDRARIDWLTWLEAAAPAGAVTLVGAAMVLLVVFRPDQAPRASRQVIRRQQRALGPLSPHERVTVVALAIFLVGMLLERLIHVEPAWLASAALVLVVAGNVLDRQSFRGSIEWGFLVLFGILLSTGGVLRHAGVDQWIAQGLVNVAQMVRSQNALVSLLAVLVIASRLVLPWIPATLLLSLALVPAATQVGLSGWVVGFTVLLAANTWLHPGQSDFCRLTRDVAGGEMFTAHHATVVGFAMSVVTIISIAVSVPFWRAIGLLAP